MTTELKRGALLQELAEICRRPYRDFADPGEMRARAILSRLAQGDDAMIEAMARAHYEEDGSKWNGGSYAVDKESWRIDMRAALAAGMREVMK